MVTCTLPTLAVGAAPDITITVTAPAEGGTITNNADVTSSTPDPDPSNNTDDEPTTVESSDDLVIVKTDNPDPVRAGETLTYTLAVSNLGPSAATDVVVTDTLPAGVTFVSATGTDWTCSEAGGVVTCTLPTLAVGAAPDITIVVTAPTTGGTITNSANVTSSTGDSDPSNNTDDEPTTVELYTDLTINITANPSPVHVYGQLVYTMSVANLGPYDADYITVTQTLPPEVTFVSVSDAIGTPSTSGWTCSEASKVVTCTRRSLGVGEIVQDITTTVIAPGTPGTLTALASIRSQTFDINMLNNMDIVSTVPVAPLTDLSIVKTAITSPVVAGEEMTYTLTVSNLGPSEAMDVEVTDVLPSGLEWISTSGQGWTCSFANNTIKCTLPSLPVGAANVINVQVMVNPSTTGSLTNTATVSTTTDDSNPSNNTDSETTEVEVITDLELIKTVEESLYIPGNTLTYKLVAINHGPSTSFNTLVTDPLPDQVRFVSAVPAPISPEDEIPVVWSLGTLLPGQSETIILVVQVKENATGDFTNMGVVSSESKETTFSNNSDSAIVAPALPTAIGLLYFKATASSGKDVSIEWAVASNLDAFGYQLYRAPTQDFGQASEVVFMSADPMGSAYQYVDRVPQDGTWYYWLVKLNTQGEQEVSDPVSVSVRDLLDPTIFRYRTFIPNVVR